MVDDANGQGQYHPASSKHNNAKDDIYFLNSHNKARTSAHRRRQQQQQQQHHEFLWTRSWSARLAVALWKYRIMLLVVTPQTQVCQTVAIVLVALSRSWNPSSHSIMLLQQQGERLKR
jgi:hypothetical protein